MKLLEYEAKGILKEAGVTVPNSVLLSQPSDTPDRLPAVIKSQVPVGGRGLAGGVRLVSDNAATKLAVKEIFNLPIKGMLPTRLLAEEALAIKREFYLALTINPQTASIQLTAGRDGGVNVETHSHDDFLQLDDPTDFSRVGEKLAEYYDLPTETFRLGELARQLVECFNENDATLLEINPLVLTADDKLVAGDCKMELDDAAGFRHTDWNFETKAANNNFVTLDPDGQIATIANGAGLAMATVDAVADAGLKPANFLDIGGGASEASVLAAFQKIMEYRRVSAIVINIFAGITRCDEVAKAIIAATNKIDRLPKLYIRLAGTNYEAAATLLEDAGIKINASLEDCLAAVKRGAA